jgi:energy-coupling factor transporter ATP-binding protein EcfA2
MRTPSLDSALNSADSILDEILRFLLTFIDFSSDTEAMASARYGLSTWFTRRLSMVPILSIAGPTGSGKSKLAQCLDCICRRPISFGDVNPVTLRSLPMRFRPTLIMDEVRLNDEMARLLRTGTHCDGFTYRNGRPIDLFCPKIVITQEPLTDAALISRAVEVRLVPTSRYMPDFSRAAIASFESEILPKIFRFFLESYDTVTAPQLNALSLSPHKRDVARALAAPSEGFDQVAVVDLLQPQDENVSVQRFFTRESAVLRVLVDAGMQKAQFVLVGEVARFANEKLEREGEWLQLSDKSAGGILAKLGFKTEKIGNTGRGIWMTQEVMKLINSLGRHYGIFVELTPVNATETQKADAGGKEPGKKPANKAAVSDTKTRKRKQRA